MNRSLHIKTVFLGATLLFAFAYIGGIFIAHERLADLRAELLVQITEQKALLFTIAETTARNGADETTEKIVRDCSLDERARFDTLLGALNTGLSPSELTELERLFGRCGSFYAERKSVMVARLSREVEVYKTFVSQLERITSVKESEFNVLLWEQLVEDEKKLSTDFSQLVVNQDKIINLLAEGKDPASADIQTILSEVKQTQQSLLDVGAAAAAKRRSLDAL